MHQLDLRQKEKNVNLNASTEDFKQHRPLNQVPSEESGTALSEEKLAYAAYMVTRVEPVLRCSSKVNVKLVLTVPAEFFFPLNDYSFFYLPHRNHYQEAYYPKSVFTKT